jgi:uncharacterized protein (TIGR03086 family)
MVGGLNRIAIMGEGGDALAVAPRADGVPDDGWLTAYRTASSRARAAWADDATLDALVEAPWGKVPGRIALSGYVQEILTHGWDLARATGQPTELDPELASWVLAVARQILPPEPRGGEIPFAPPVPRAPHPRPAAAPASRTSPVPLYPPVCGPPGSARPVPRLDPGRCHRVPARAQQEQARCVFDPETGTRGPASGAPRAAPAPQHPWAPPHRLTAYRAFTAASVLKARFRVLLRAA